MIVCIDPGHGGTDPGAVGPTGTREKDIALAVSKKVAEKLQNAGVATKLTRTTDIFVNLQQRCDISNSFNTDYFVSIHCNSAANSVAKGMEVYTSRGQTKADPFAEAIANELQKSFTNLTLRTDLTDKDKDKEAGYYVLVHTKAPATLIELAFISNPEEEKMLQDSSYQDKVATTIVNAICKYAGIAVKQVKEDDDVTKTKIIFGNTQLDGFIKDGTSYVEVRKLAEALGLNVVWNSATGTVTLTKK
ncbi:MAG TPA: N-acetylmuramoyl-L-alanine amidase [Thermoanaerobacterium sp.]|nr:N-acetylmuramoyl-L-alanine amidase [Thermoanaerobacterium sp.]